MTLPITLAEALPPRLVINPQTTNGGITSDAISMKTFLRGAFVVSLTQAVGHATSVALRQATDVAIGTNAAGPTSLIWSNEDTTDDLNWQEETAGASFAVAADALNKIVVIDVDPALLTDTYDVVYITVSDSSQATNLCSAMFYGYPRYPSRAASIQSAIID